MLNKSTGDVVGMKEELGRMLASVITLRGARGGRGGGSGG